jgi:hypothetical protein
VYANILGQLRRMKGGGADPFDARVMPMPNDIIVLVPDGGKGRALMFDVIKNSRVAYLVMDDPAHLIDRFWRLHSKIFLNGEEQREMAAMISDARHFSGALASAREQLSIRKEITAAAFYC